VVEAARQTCVAGNTCPADRGSYWNIGLDCRSMQCQMGACCCKKFEIWIWEDRCWPVGLVMES
jgi:hypothetical protein